MHAGGVIVVQGNGPGRLKRNRRRRSRKTLRRVRSRDQTGRRVCLKVAIAQPPSARRFSGETKGTTTTRSGSVEDRSAARPGRGRTRATGERTRARPRDNPLRDRGAQSSDLVWWYRRCASTRIEGRAHQGARHATTDLETAATV